MNKIVITIPTRDEIQEKASELWSKHKTPILIGGAVITNAILYTKLQSTKDELDSLENDLLEWHNADGIRMMGNKAATSAIRSMPTATEEASPVISIRDENDEYFYSIVKLDQEEN